jgi:cathepsin B
MHVPKMPMTIQKNTVAGTPPASWNWITTNGPCTNVIRNQGQCGDCWAFSAVGVFSDGRCIKGLDKTRVQYSEQYVTSCDKIDQGCNGGYLNWVWVFLSGTGTDTDACTPNTSAANGTTGICPTKCHNGSAIALTKAAGNATMVCTGGTTSIENALVTLPLTTGFTVYYDFEVYTSGIYQHLWGPEMGGHAVEFVGYGTQNGEMYWLVKNSWGSTWGEKGYFQILKGVNECGIESNCYLADL